MKMGEGDETKTEIKESVVTNGTKESEKVVEKKEEENGVKEMEEGEKEDVEKSDGDTKEKDMVGDEGGHKVEKEAGVEVPETEAMEEDDPNVEKEAEVVEEKGVPKTEAMEEVEKLNEDEKEDKTEGNIEGLDEKMDGVVEAKDEKVKESDEDKGSEEEKEPKTEKDGKEEMGSVEEKGSKKRSRAKTDQGKSSDGKKKVVEKEPEPRTPVTDRPVRERKSVERLVATIEKDNSKEFHIEKGSGTLLKDIPNVAYKLSKKKNEEIFKALHAIVYGRRGKATEIKHNISRFSGFVWHENEEKQKLKVKEKFDKIVKEKLLEFCDVLDIPVSRATSRKEDIVANLLDFLVAPHATTTVSLAEQDPGRKRKRPATKVGSTSTSSKGSNKSRKKTSDASKEGKKATRLSDGESEEEEEEKENGTVKKSEDEKSERSESDDKNDASENDASENDSEEENVKEKAKAEKSKKQTKNKTPRVESSGKGTSKKVITPTKPRSIPKGTSRKSSASRFKTGEGKDTAPKVFSRKKKTEEPKKEKSSGSKKLSTKEKSGGKAKPKEVKLKPSDDELRNAICDILKQVDFNTATFTDILKQLAEKFSTDLTPRKASIKLMIQDELTKLADEAEDDEDEEGNEEDAGKDEAQPAGKQVKA